MGRRTVREGPSDPAAKMSDIIRAMGLPPILRPPEIDEAFHLERLPKRILIQGGGYIAVEFACIFHGLGSEVTVVYRGEKIIAEAYNLRESNSDPTGHAELLAMSMAGKKLGEWRLTECSLAVTLEPCPMCAGAMVNARLGRVLYGATDPKAGACHTLYHIPTDSRLNHEVEVIGNVLANKCRTVLRNFFQQRREMNRQGSARRND